MMSRNRSLSWHSMSRTMVRRFGISFFSLIASILMFPMSRTYKTGRNHPSCLVPYSIYVRLETSGIASSHSMLRSKRRIARLSTHSLGLGLGPRY
ncbi:hypothetical protein BGW80DRAFT_1355786 [Lactifluus volemus]|nr:hypothetical protein BGW80DRAFT_1355786 [Lactifluus volemus]